MAITCSNIKIAFKSNIKILYSKVCLFFTILLLCQHLSYYLKYINIYIFLKLNNK